MVMIMKMRMMATRISSHHWGLLLTPKGKKTFLLTSKCLMG